ncbi:hypothetical protein CBL_08661 [Carabus blaptoides fortunei]
MFATEPSKWKQIEFHQKKPRNVKELQSTRVSKAPSVETLWTNHKLQCPSCSPHHLQPAQPLHQHHPEAPRLSPSSFDSLFNTVFPLDAFERHLKALTFCLCLQSNVIPFPEFQTRATSFFSIMFGPGVLQDTGSEWKTNLAVH